MANAPLLLVDGSSYLYRAFHALPPLSTSKGQPTGAVRGVISMLKRLIADYPDSQVVVIFDAKGKTFRDDIYPEYKANRPPMPDDLRLQIEPLHQIIRAMGLPLVVIEGVEADDVIGTLAQQADQLGEKCIISTGDKDMAQLVNDNVSLVNTMDNTVMDIPGVEKKFGIPPRYIIDYLALMGDKVDNIPGVPGVGEKTALALIQGLGGIDEIYSNLEKIKDLSFRGAKNMAAKMLENKEQAYLSYRLATIKTDVDIHRQSELLQAQEADNETLLKQFTELEFKSWALEMQQTSPAIEAEQIPTEYSCILEQATFDAWIKQLSACEAFAIDTETTSLNYMQAKIVGVSFAIEPGKAAYVPCGHDYLGAPNQLALDYVLNALKPILENPEIIKIGQNLKYDAEVLLNYGVKLKGKLYDTMLESYTFNAIGNRHDMDTLAATHLGIKTTHFEDVAGKGAKQLSFNQVDIQQAAPYAAEDADITLRLHHKLWPQLEQKAGPKTVFESIEMPLLPVLITIERNGAMIDAQQLKQQSLDHAATMQALEQKAYELAGEEFNLGSPKQLAEILFNKQKLPVLKKTAKKAPSTAEEVLQELSLDYPLPKVIMDYRSLSKLKNTYTDKLPQMINPQTGRVHTSYHQAVTATGRLSSSDPNLQNIPIRTTEGRRIRQAFIAPPGYKIIAADYSQIELRIMAHLSGDASLTEAFNNDMDVHKATASEVFATELERVSTEQRRSAKAINFGLIYGMSAFGLAKQLRIGRNDAQGYINTYFERYPGVKNYMDGTRESAREKGYVETLFGRRLYLPEINTRNGMRRAAAERTAINAPMQGTASDIIKRAMTAVHEWLLASQIDAKIIMQVHDELVLEVAQDDLDTVKTQVCNLMAQAANLSVPLIVEAGSGDNWDQAH